MEKNKAIVINKISNSIDVKLTNKKLRPLNDHEVIIQNMYSDLNYKDMLATKLNSGVIKNYPIVPGVDLSGIITESKSNKFKKGDIVLVTGYGLGTIIDGGLEEYTIVPDNWIIKIPSNLNPREVMLYGTAGLTAGLSINKLIKNNPNKDKKILITGGSGGVASIAVRILNKLGYKNITLATRSLNKEKELKKLGATNVITNESLRTNKLLDHQKYDLVIDTIGEKTIENIFPQIKYNGAISICGNVSGSNLNTNIFPFILRNITLYGIDSVNIPISEKEYIWDKLSNQWNIVESINYDEISLNTVLDKITKIAEGNNFKRNLVKIN